MNDLKEIIVNLIEKKLKVDFGISKEAGTKVMPTYYTILFAWQIISRIEMPISL